MQKTKFSQILKKFGIKIPHRRSRPTEEEKTFSQGEILVSKTNVRGLITYVNAQFVEISGYSQDELLEQPHSITRHPKMPKIIFKVLWDNLKSGQEVNAFVVNLAKDGSYYWVFANVTPSFDASNKIIGFHSTRRRPNRKGLTAIIELYKELRQYEIIGGIKESEIVLKNFLEKEEVSYDKFVFNLQYS
jgi:PAS domain S-box-containing protein